MAISFQNKNIPEIFSLESLRFTIHLARICHLLLLCFWLQILIFIPDIRLKQIDILIDQNITIDAIIVIH